jgi:hypothetical protein
LRIRGAPVHQKLDMMLENKVVQKLKLEKKICTKKWSSKLIFLNDFFFFNSVDFVHRKLALKVRFQHFLTNHNSLQDYFKTTFEHVDSCAKILHFRTHHLQSSTTELTLMYMKQHEVFPNSKSHNSLSRISCRTRFSLLGVIRYSLSWTACNSNKAA